MDKRELAQSYFKQGYNCAQAVCLAFRDELKKSEAELALAGGPFGGGLARMRSVCGAVSGAAYVLGQLYGYTEAKDVEGKKRLYALVQEFADAYKAEFGSIVCAELLLGGSFEISHNPELYTPTPEERTTGYYKKRPCVELVGTAAEILEKMIEKHS